MTNARRLLCLLALVACGKDVDIGGTTDAGVPDSTVDSNAPDSGGSSAVCEPCAMTSECATNVVCAHLTSTSANGFCLRTCANVACDADDVCTDTTTSTGTAVKACVPRTGMCTPAPPPQPQPDGAPLERCGDLVGPTISAQCHSCEFDCQANGCYGGYWCDTATRRCQRPPTCN